MRRLITGLALGGLTLAGLALAVDGPSAAAVPPAPRIDVRAAGPTEAAVLAGGCFWGIEGVFEHVKGVRQVVSGYAGGRAGDASYDKVSSEGTGHAEAVRIVYDPRQVSYGTLLRVFFEAHDPTQLNRQGPDTGTSYRSAIFPQNAGQKRAAAAYVAQLNSARTFGRPVATRIESGGFYPAEAYHQGFLRRNPTHPYIQHWDLPKLAALKRDFPALWRP
jgi:peptide-methionine (S)-S-oxide reductase